tara:strand:+ start:354 stop:758 length:405 start_codon:yes stop_codon:yes gene_type:complete
MKYFSLNLVKLIQKGGVFKKEIIIFLLLFSFCSTQEDVNINEDGLITCAEDEKDSEGRCYEPDDELTGEDNTFLIFPGTEKEANKIIECVRQYDDSLRSFPDAVVNSTEIAFNITNHTDGTYGLIDEALASCGY